MDGGEKGEIEGEALGEAEATAADDHHHQSQFEEGRRKGTDGRRRNRRRGKSGGQRKGQINGQKRGVDIKYKDRQTDKVMDGQAKLWSVGIKVKV